MEKLREATMTTDVDTRDRVIRVGVELEAVKRDIDELKVQVTDMQAQISDIHSLLTQAKGAKSVITWLVAVGSSGIFVGMVSNAKAILQFLKGG